MLTSYHAPIGTMPGNGVPIDGLWLQTGLLFDYDGLCAHHLPALRAVLNGGRSRYRFQFEDATFLFHHGCLMSRVIFRRQICGMPPFALTPDGQPYLRALPKRQQACLQEFLALPKGILLFYFTLLKKVFECKPLVCYQESSQTGHLAQVNLPQALLPILAEVGWETALISNH